MIAFYCFIGYILVGFIHLYLLNYANCIVSEPVKSLGLEEHVLSIIFILIWPALTISVVVKLSTVKGLEQRRRMGL